MTFRILALAFACGVPAVAAAQPFGWFTGSSGLEVINFVTGATVISTNAPAGVQIGDGDIDRVNGHYLAVTNIGTFRVRLSPPTLEPGLLPYAGSKLRVSPNGEVVFVCTAAGTECQWIRRATDQRRTFALVVDAAFAPDGSLLMITRAAATSGPFALHRLSATTGETQWTTGLGDSAGPLLVGRTRAVVHSFNSETRLRVYDLSNGSSVGEIVPGFVDRAVVTGTKLYFLYYPTGSGQNRLARYDLDTLAGEGEAAVRNMFLGSALSLQLSADGQRLYALRYIGGRIPTANLETYDATTLQLLYYRPANPSRLNMAVSPDPVCPFTITPAQTTLQVPAKGGLVELRVQAEPRCGPWSIGVFSQSFVPGLLGPAARTGSSTVHVVVGENALRFSTNHSVHVSGIGYTITQAAETALPNPPLDVRVRVEGATPTVMWSMDDGPLTTGFVVAAGPAGGAPALSEQLPATARSWSRGPLPPGNYFVQVRALNNAGSSPMTAPVSFGVGASQPPAAPANLRSDVRGRHVRLTWDAPAGTPLATRYVIEAGPPGAARAVVAQTSDATPEFAAGNVPLATWSVAVRAVNDAGTSNPSNVVTLTTTPCTTSPEPPGSFSAVVAGNVLSLSWQMPPSGADAFLLEAGSTIGASDLAQLTLPASRTRADLPAPPGVYALRLRAVNQCGHSSPSIERAVHVR